MPRQDVPYGGEICSLKERIAEIWDKLGEKLRSINGVEGDGAGDVKIVSGDAAVVISNDQIGHKIEVGLDKSKLPRAAVSSVNGQTGAVALNAGDIPSNGNSDVQTEIDVGKAGLQNCIANITAEREARQNGDAALQGNINSVQASIPGAAAAAVAADPTVARLARDVADKVDKITGGSTKRAYTHTGSVQDDTPAVNGPDANSIGLRDANGRMQAADPASGAADKTLVTANWVSQTGEGKPNNVLHDTGDETKKGKLTLENSLTLYNSRWQTIPSAIFKWAFDSTTPPTKFVAVEGGFAIKDVNSRTMWQLKAYRDTDGRDVLEIHGFAYDNTDAYFHFEIGPNGYRKITTNFDKPSNW